MMETINWTADMETCLFYAMMDHKPVGENKHFNMIFIYEKYNNLCEKKLSSEQIWEHLNTLYDLQALNDTEIVPFPNEESDFSLNDSEYENLKKNVITIKVETKESKTTKENNRKSVTRKTKESINESDDSDDNDSKAGNNETNNETQPIPSSNSNKKDNLNNETNSVGSNSNNTDMATKNEESDDDSDSTEVISTPKQEVRKRANLNRTNSVKKSATKSATKKRRV